jgi:hypothetical protein
MERWYKLVEFRCPGCGQRLAVESRQILRQETVTCQDCNTDLLLRPCGTTGVVDPVATPWRAVPPRIVELRA